MNKLIKTEELVKDVLIRFDDSRSDDFILIYRVFKEVNENAVIRNPFYHVMLNHDNYNFPAIASIMRARRKIYQKYPDLKPEKVTKARNKKIEEYKEYSRS
jgi:hypothetical protein